VISKPVRDRGFLSWAKEQGGQCCVCWRLAGERRPAQNLHHFASDKSMGTKGSDHVVARVCRTCHSSVQGKRRLAFMREDQFEILSALQEDAIALLSGFVEHLTSKE
jgi:heterodisulfide reductase subunit B